MKVSLFDFALPEALIALRPAEPRDAARMLIVPCEPAPFLDETVRELPRYLRAGDLLVFNDTKVLPVHFSGLRTGRAGTLGLPHARVEITLHKRAGPNSWLAFAKGAKKLHPGDQLTLNAALSALVAENHGDGEVLLDFALEGDALDAAIKAAGEMPLPPYIAARRPRDAQDRADYQTVFAREDGSVAAPTAGLHFTPALFARLAEAGINRAMVTLHVGAGTFLPMKADDTRDHVMHAEWGEVSAEAAEAVNRTREAGGRIVAVGTTSLRLLESAADESARLKPFRGETAIFITPGYRFKACDMLLTNFHLPRSTLFMLVSAFAGLERMKAAYAHAIGQGYRFYSYGDASLLFRAT
ncbi:MAG: tRNA preQ1(34) S-adenosylmethionine ribosyltransferase-isomerase QueA [Alphaproteobacteria bacterium]|nr:tRNA preQ1(34) S-adenosylmethionine ribosyltransferase-isomerase QueA [Alphaproteobacteria bacterium]